MRDGKRIIAWEPVESEWDETERNWMLALDDFERDLCPSCGLPHDICHSPTAETSMHAEAEVCWATVHQQQAARKLRDQNPESIWNDALTTRLHFE